MGDNGIRPMDALAARRKCPDNPTKTKHLKLADAEKAAAQSSKQLNRTIVPYACAGCGFYHLTGKTDGSDVVRSENGVLKTSALSAREANYSKPIVAERIQIVPDEIIPANPAARLKAVEAAIKGRTEISTAEIMVAANISRGSVATYMNKLGWKADRGPGAQWRPSQWRPEAGLTAVPGGKSTGNAALEASIARHPASRGGAPGDDDGGDEWPPDNSWVIEAFPPDVNVQTYLRTLATAGLTVQVRAWVTL